MTILKHQLRLDWKPTSMAAWMFLEVWDLGKQIHLGNQFDVTGGSLTRQLHTLHVKVLSREN